MIIADLALLLLVVCKMVNCIYHNVCVGMCVSVCVFLDNA